MKQEQEQTKTDRVRRLLLLFLLVVVLGGAYLVFCRVTGVGIPCVFHLVTGLQCPGCGMTRAVVALSQFHIAEALQYHPLIFLYILYIAWYVIGSSIHYVRGDKDPLVLKPLFLHIIFLVVIVLFGILRNFL